MRIAFFSDTYLPTFDGVVSSVIDFHNELNKRGHDVMIYAPHWGTDDYNIVGFPLIPINQYDHYGLTIIPQKYYHILEGKNNNGGGKRTDIIHAHGIGPMGWRALWASIRLNIPLVLTWHTMIQDAFKIYLPNIGQLSWKLVKLYLALFFKQCKLIFTPSVDTKYYLMKEFDGLIDGWALGEKIRIVPNGIDLGKYKPIERTNSKTVLYVGRIAPEKKVETIIGEFLEVREFTDIRLMIVGTGPDLPRLREKYADPGVVDFMGWAEEDVKIMEYQNADVFVTASEFETQGLTLIEAMACGCPVIGPQSRAIPEAIKDNWNGYLYDPAEPVGLQMAIIKALRNRDRLSNCALEMAQAFDMSACAAKLESCYYDVLGAEIMRREYD